jgi:hypothetical protein
MVNIIQPLAITGTQAPRSPLRFFRFNQPAALIMAWGIYSLAALAYFGYHSAALGNLCSALK